MKSFASFILLIALGSVSTPLASAQTLTTSTIAAEATTLTGDFIKKRYTVNGSWEIKESDGKYVIQFSDDFKTKSGPDLKVFLSTKNIDDVDRKTATDGAVNIGVLKSSKGKQSYTIPQNINLSDYKSVIVHCEAYSVLWGGFDIPE